MKIRTVAIVSLSSGIAGEGFARHEVEIGVRRLREMGLTVTWMPHARMGISYVQAHPEDRAADLIAALRDSQIDMILCAIGGDDTYRLLPYLFEGDELKNAAADKVFLGFSDTTLNHFMLRKAGIKSFYGQAFLPDVCELGPDMLPYTKRYFEELIAHGAIREVKPSPVWYRERESFGEDQVGKALPALIDDGFHLLQGSPVFSGQVMGGCIDSMFDMLDGSRYADMPALCEKYGLFPDAREWRGKILLLESSEEKMPPEKYGQALRLLKERGVFDAVNGVLVGKPMDRIYEREYLNLLIQTVGQKDLPILCNVNIGHAAPRCIIPLGIECTVDAKEQRITFS